MNRSMTRLSKSRWTFFRQAAIALAALGVVGAVTIGPASADEWRGRGEWHDHGWHRGWYDHDWHRHSYVYVAPGYGYPDYAYSPGYYYAPAPEVYVPPPVVYEPPSIDLVFPIHIR